MVRTLDFFIVVVKGIVKFILRGLGGEESEVKRYSFVLLWHVNMGRLKVALTEN